MSDKHEHPDCQAWRVFDRFGGVMKTAKALKALGPQHARDRSTLYRWTYPREKNGTGGLIPASAMPSIMRAARLHGIVIRPDDIYPSGGVSSHD